MITSSVKTIGVDESVAALLSLASGRARLAAVRSGAKATQSAVKNWYREKGRNHWKGTGPTQGPGRKASRWWMGTSRWRIESATQQGAIVSNDHIGLAHKITGGVIRAKRKGFLTIPVHPKAHGLTAKTFSQTIAPLFRIKNVLAMKTTSGRSKKEAIKPVFVLKKSVNQAPWPNAMPPDNVFMKPFEEALLDSIEQSYMEKQ